MHALIRAGCLTRLHGVGVRSDSQLLTPPRATARPSLSSPTAPCRYRPTTATLKMSFPALRWFLMAFSTLGDISRGRVSFPAGAGALAQLARARADTRHRYACSELSC
jgi:hypothetical protein